MPEEPLLPVLLDELVETLAIALAVHGDALPTRGPHGTPPHKLDAARARLARRLADQLTLSGYVVLRRPPQRRWSTSDLAGPPPEADGK